MNHWIPTRDRHRAPHGEYTLFIPEEDAVPVAYNEAGSAVQGSPLEANADYYVRSVGGIELVEMKDGEWVSAEAAFVAAPPKNDLFVPFLSIGMATMLCVGWCVLLLNRIKR